VADQCFSVGFFLENNSTLIMPSSVEFLIGNLSGPASEKKAT
jgi:hypothetical protein